MAFEQAKRILRNEDARLFRSEEGIYDDNVVILFWDNIESRYIDECIRYLNDSTNRVLTTPSSGNIEFFDISFGHDLYHLHAYYEESNQRLFRVLMKSALTSAPHGSSDTKWKLQSGETYNSGTSNIVLAVYNVRSENIHALETVGLNETYTDAIYLLDGTQLTGTWFNIARESDYNSDTGLYDLRWYLSKFDAKEYIFHSTATNESIVVDFFKHHMTASAITNFENNYYFDSSVPGDYYYSTDGSNYTKKNDVAASGSLPSTAKRIIDDADGRIVRYTQRPDRESGEIDATVQLVFARTRDTVFDTEDVSDGSGYSETITKKYNQSSAETASGFAAGKTVKVENILNEDGTYNTVLTERDEGQRTATSGIDSPLTSTKIIVSDNQTAQLGEPSEDVTFNVTGVTSKTPPVFTDGDEGVKIVSMNSQVYAESLTVGLGSSVYFQLLDNGTSYELFGATQSDFSDEVSLFTKDKATIESESTNPALGDTTHPHYIANSGLSFYKYYFFSTSTYSSYSNFRVKVTTAETEILPNQFYFKTGRHTTTDFEGLRGFKFIGTRFGSEDVPKYYWQLTRTGSFATYTLTSQPFDTLEELHRSNPYEFDWSNITGTPDVDINGNPYLEGLEFSNISYKTITHESEQLTNGLFRNRKTITESHSRTTRSISSMGDTSVETTDVINSTNMITPKSNIQISEGVSVEFVSNVNADGYFNNTQQITKKESNTIYCCYNTDVDNKEIKLYFSNVKASQKENIFKSIYIDIVNNQYGSSVDYYYQDYNTGSIYKNNLDADSIPETAKNLTEFQEGREVVVRSSYVEEFKVYNMEIIIASAIRSSEFSASPNNIEDRFVTKINNKTTLTVDEGFNISKEELSFLRKTYYNNPSSGEVIDFTKQRLSNGNYNYRVTTTVRTGYTAEFVINHNCYYYGIEYPVPPTTDPSADPNQYYKIDITYNKDVQSSVSYNNDNDTWNWIFIEKKPDQIRGEQSTIVLNYADGTKDATSGNEWHPSTTNPLEYYYATYNNVNPSVPNTSLFYNLVKLTEGTPGSLKDFEFGYGDNDSLGFDTFYIRLKDNENRYSVNAADGLQLSSLGQAGSFTSIANKQLTTTLGIPMQSESETLLNPYGPVSFRTGNNTNNFGDNDTNGLQILSFNFDNSSSRRGPTGSGLRSLAWAIPAYHENLQIGRGRRKDHLTIVEYHDTLADTGSVYENTYNYVFNKLQSQVATLTKKPTFLQVDNAIGPTGGKFVEGQLVTDEYGVQYLKDPYTFYWGDLDNHGFDTIYIRLPKELTTDSYSINVDLTYDLLPLHKDQNNENDNLSQLAKYNLISYNNDDNDNKLWGKTDYIANAFTTHPPMFAYTGVLGSTNMFFALERNDPQYEWKASQFYNDLQYRVSPPSYVDRASIFYLTDGNGESVRSGNDHLKITVPENFMFPRSSKLTGNQFEGGTQYSKQSAVIYPHDTNSGTFINDVGRDMGVERQPHVGGSKTIKIFSYEEMFDINTGKCKDYLKSIYNASSNEEWESVVGPRHHIPINSQTCDIDINPIVAGESWNWNKFVAWYARADAQSSNAIYFTALNCSEVSLFWDVADDPLTSGTDNHYVDFYHSTGVGSEANSRGIPPVYGSQLLPAMFNIELPVIAGDRLSDDEGWSEISSEVYNNYHRFEYKTSNGLPAWASKDYEHLLLTTSYEKIKDKVAVITNDRVQLNNGQFNAINNSVTTFNGNPLSGRYWHIKRSDNGDPNLENVTALYINGVKINKSSSPSGASPSFFIAKSNSNAAYFNGNSLTFPTIFIKIDDNGTKGTSPFAAGTVVEFEEGTKEAFQYGNKQFYRGQIDAYGKPTLYVKGFSGQEIETNLFYGIEYNGNRFVKSNSGSNTYYITASDSGNPNIDLPRSIILNNTEHKRSTLDPANLITDAHTSEVNFTFQWSYGKIAADNLSFDTIYFNLPLSGITTFSVLDNVINQYHYYDESKSINYLNATESEKIAQAKTTTDLVVTPVYYGDFANGNVGGLYLLEANGISQLTSKPSAVGFENNLLPELSISNNNIFNSPGYYFGNLTIKRNTLSSSSETLTNKLFIRLPGIDSSPTEFSQYGGLNPEFTSTPIFVYPSRDPNILSEKILSYESVSGTGALATFGEPFIKKEVTIFRNLTKDVIPSEGQGTIAADGKSLTQIELSTRLNEDTLLYDVDQVKTTITAPSDSTSKDGWFLLGESTSYEREVKQMRTAGLTNDGNQWYTFSPGYSTFQDATNGGWYDMNFYGLYMTRKRPVREMAHVHYFVTQPTKAMIDALTGSSTPTFQTAKTIAGISQDYLTEFATTPTDTQLNTTVKYAITGSGTNWKLIRTTLIKGSWTWDPSNTPDLEHARLEKCKYHVPSENAGANHSEAGMIPLTNYIHLHTADNDFGDTYSSLTSNPRLFSTNARYTASKTFFVGLGANTASSLGAVAISDVPYPINSNTDTTYAGSDSGTSGSSHIHKFDELGSEFTYYSDGVATGHYGFINGVNDYSKDPIDITEI